MAIEILDIGTMDPKEKGQFMFAVGRQEDMDGRSGEALRESIETAIAAGKTVEAHREMNTNAILHLVVGGTTFIDKYTSNARAELAGSVE